MQFNHYGIFNLNRWSDLFTITEDVNIHLQRKLHVIGLPNLNNIQTAYYAGGASAGVFRVRKNGVILPYVIRLFRGVLNTECIQQQEASYHYLEQLRVTNHPVSRYFPRACFFKGGFVTPEEESMPFVVMDFVPGLTLNDYVRQCSIENLELLTERLLNMVMLLHAAGISLSDFAPDNLLVDDCLTLKIVDLDEVFYPGCIVKTSRFSGKASCIHRNRRPERPVPLCSNIGNFSELLLYTSMLALKYREFREYLKQHEFLPDSPLLFTQEDLENPESSLVFLRLSWHHDEKLRFLAECLYSFATAENPSLTPSLRDILCQYYSSKRLEKLSKLANYDDNLEAMSQLSEAHRYGFGAALQDNQLSEYWQRRSKS